jgi:ABC-type transport system involved in multi-copper enzyme maturation permease subunit
MIKSILIIYIIGFIISYFIIKHFQRKNNEHTLSNLLLRFSISMLSWFFIIAVIIAFSTEIKQWFKKLLDKELPKWL